ncbi:phage major capsid protein [Marinihelvus fidelis]|uniref:Phage major capsid protein n=1 Tax=Marinihelvus fidelis TaxID=2613842 RepID=A0A5N0TEK3_9GAMM|nr:phage major capsid protein [Marinihelvus fidelis]KAA9133462.1 phage major capsid protein [Marinihelvus fidelis]
MPQGKRDGNHGLNHCRVLDNAQIRVLERAEGDEYDRIELSFSSEYEVERWYGVEILDHSDGAVDLDRLNNGGSFLVNHRWDDQVGVIEEARVENKRGIAVIRFSRSDRGQEIFQDMADGIRTLVSVGYRIREMVLEKHDDDEGETYRILRWEPFEISTVSVPADPTVGVGREFEERFGGEAEQKQAFRSLVGPGVESDSTEEDKAMPEKRKDAAGNNDPVDITAAENQAATQERARVQTIMRLGHKYDMNDDAERAVQDGASVGDFRDKVLGKIERDANKAPATSLDMDEKETRQYSIVRAIQASISGNWKNAGLERAASEAVAKQVGGDARGFFVPHDIQVRKQQVAVAGDGGNLVADNLLAGSFIEQLYARSVLVSRGITTLPGLVGDVDIPRRTEGATFYWLGEDDDGTDSDSAFDLLSLSPKTVAGAVPITRKMIKQGTPGIEALVMSDLSKGAALAIDKAGLEGTGSGNDQPLGIVGQSGVNTATIASAAAPTFIEMVGFETALDADDALMGDLSYITTPAMYGTLRTTKVDAGSGVLVADKLGYDIHRSTQLSANRIIFGDYSQVLMGMWGVLDVMVDTATKVAAGGLVLRVFQDIDIGVRHPESFAINNTP